MEQDLKEIEEKVMQFCKKYNCILEIDTLTAGRTTNGDIIPIKVCTKIKN